MLIYIIVPSQFPRNLRLNSWEVELMTWGPRGKFIYICIYIDWNLGSSRKLGSTLHLCIWYFFSVPNNGKNHWNCCFLEAFGNFWTNKIPKNRGFLGPQIRTPLKTDKIYSIKDQKWEFTNIYPQNRRKNTVRSVFLNLKTGWLWCRLAPK